MEKISAVLIVKNEEQNIKRCLNSLLWVDEIIILDTGSTDNTIQICQQFNCKIYYSKFLGFGETKKKAVSYATNNWILSIDADEEVSKELQKKIQTILSNDSKYYGYKIKRKTFYLGKIINHCGWSNDYPLRLFNKKKGNFNQDIVHEKIIINGPVSQIEEALYHYSYPTLSNHIKKIELYSTLGAQKLIEKNKSPNILDLIFRPIIKFIKMYIIKLGFLDGKEGLILSIMSSFSVFLKYAKFFEKKLGIRNFFNEI